VGKKTPPKKICKGPPFENDSFRILFVNVFRVSPRMDKCLQLLIDTNRLPEAAFLARTYLPSHVSR